MNIHTRSQACHTERLPLLLTLAYLNKRCMPACLPDCLTASLHTCLPNLLPDALIGCSIHCPR